MAPDIFSESLSERRNRLLAAASDLRVWAAERHLLGGAGAPAGSGEAQAQSAGGAARGFSADAIAAIQLARLTGFSVNAKSNTIYMLGTAKPTKKIRAALPQSLQDGTKVEYAQARPISVGDSPSDSTFGVVGAFQKSGRYTCGASVSPGNNRMAGTLGALIRIGGKLHGLSNNHVTGGCSQLPTGMPILAPGVMDVMAGGVTPFTLGAHEMALSMVAGDPSIVDVSENSDAAAFTITDPKLISSSQRDYFDTPSVVGGIDDDMVVEKVGRTTGLTHGKVTSLASGTRSVSYRTSVWTSPDTCIPVNTVVHFPNVWLVKGAGGGSFSEDGDSGSLVVGLDAKGKRMAVGLLFAGNADFTYVLELAPILKRLGATLVSGHNTV